MVYNGIMTSCKFVFAERYWHQDVVGNGKAGTPVPEGKKRFITYGKHRLKAHRTRIDRHNLNFSKGS